MIICIKYFLFQKDNYSSWFWNFLIWWPLGKLSSLCPAFYVLFDVLYIYYVYIYIYIYIYYIYIYFVTAEKLCQMVIMTANTYN